jgi:hypothetical protein
MDSNASCAGEVERKVWRDNDSLLCGQLLKAPQLVVGRPAEPTLRKRGAAARPAWRRPVMAARTVCGSQPSRFPISATEAPSSFPMTHRCRHSVPWSSDTRLPARDPI